MTERKKIALTKHDKNALRSLRQFMQEHLTARHTIAGLSSIAGINRYKLTYGFKLSYKTSIHQYLIKLRMIQAKDLLTSTDKPFKEIAGMCGYSHAENFTHAFKKYYGYTPSYLKRK